MGVRHDVDMVAGAAFVFPVSWEQRDGTKKPLTSYDAELQVRTSAGAAGEPLVAISSAPDDGITLAAAGDIDVFISSTRTLALLPYIGKTLVYDLVLISKTNAEDRRQLVWGEVEVGPGVSR